MPKEGRSATFTRALKETASTQKDTESSGRETTGTQKRTTYLNVGVRQYAAYTKGGRVSSNLWQREWLAGGMVSR